MLTSLPRRLLAEGLGTGLLVAVVVGSGIAASRLSPQDVGLQLLENSLATAFGLAVLIAVLHGCRCFDRDGDGRGERADRS